MRDSSVKVLLADDSALVCDRIASILSEYPQIEIVGKAHTGLEAIKKVVFSNPDVVVLDIRMPEGNGIHVLETIKNAHPDTTVIMLTNFPYLQYRKICLDAGADYFFDKSNEFLEVVEVIKWHIDGCPGDGYERN
jgi:DNA-binding NarL/FixJ family response regulator